MRPPDERAHFLCKGKCRNRRGSVKPMSMRKNGGFPWTVRKAKIIRPKCFPLAIIESGEVNKKGFPLRGKLSPKGTDEGKQFPLPIEKGEGEYIC